MVLVFLLLILSLTCYHVRITCNTEYLSKKQTTSINGIFILIVFLSHANGYIKISGLGGAVYSLFFAVMGQMMVVMFLFYSGYGIMTQFGKKGEIYKEHFLTRRVIKTWFFFVIALSAYYLENKMLGISYPVSRMLLSILAWENIGNSNWYIFDILVLYLLFYTSMILSSFMRNKQNAIVLLVWMLTIVFWIFLYYTKQRYWYDTILAFPYGITISAYKNQFDLMLRNKKRFWIYLSIVCLAFLFFYTIRGPIGISISSLMFSTIIVLISSRVEIGNKVLFFFGTHLFEIYIYQRIPMIALNRIGLENPSLFITVSFVLTIIIAIASERLRSLIDKNLF